MKVPYVHIKPSKRDKLTRKEMTKHLVQKLLRKMAFLDFDTTFVGTVNFNQFTVPSFMLMFTRCLTLAASEMCLKNHESC